jgi:hypothetical protein
VRGAGIARALNVRLGPGALTAALVVAGAVLGVGHPVAVATPPVAAAGIPAAPGIPHFTHLVSIDGLPADRDATRAFMAAFRGAFAQASFVTEKLEARRKQYVQGIPISNRFRLIEGSSGEGTFQLQVVIEWTSLRDTASSPALPDSTAAPAPDSTTSREATVLIVALSPEAAAAQARPIPVRERLVFHFPVEPRSKFFSAVGRRVAMLSLETLHHLTDDLDRDLRLRIDRVDRVGLSSR